MKNVIISIFAVLFCMTANAQDVNKIKNKIFDNFNKLSIAQELTEEQRQVVYNDVICHMCDSVVLAEDAIMLSLMWRKPILNRAAVYARGLKDGSITGNQGVENSRSSIASNGVQNQNEAYKQECLSIALNSLPDNIAKEVTEAQREKIYNEIINPEFDRLIAKHGSINALRHYYNSNPIASKASEAFQLAVENERKRVQEEAKRAQEEAFLVTSGAGIEQNLDQCLANAVEYAKLFDEHYNAEAYKLFVKIKEMILNGQLEYTYNEITPVLKFYGWVDHNGVPYGPARIVRTYKAQWSTYSTSSFDIWYDGVFYAGKPIYGRIESEDNYNPTMNGFMDTSLKATQNSRSFMRYKSLMASMDRYGKADGVRVGDDVTFMKSGKYQAENFYGSVFYQEDIAKFYNHITKNTPQSDAKVVQNFEIEPGVIYTGGWKDGAPYGCGVTLQQGVLIGDNKKSDGSSERYVISQSRYDEAKESEKGWHSTSIMSDKRLGISFPKNNKNVGYEFVHTSKSFDVYTLVEKIPASVDTLDNYRHQNMHYLGHRFTIESGIMRCYYYPLGGKAVPNYTYVGISPKGSYTIEAWDENNNHKYMQRVIDSYTFEGKKLTDNEYLGVYYDKEQFIYIGHLLQINNGKMIKNGLGYLIDANDGEIMRQGVWNNDALTQNQQVKETINAELSVDISELVARYKKDKNNTNKKLPQSVSAQFNFDTVMYEHMRESKDYK